ncbi:lysine N(6)-hydroxylase/L-ornithine N(5)-oxygenase family protein [Vibrio sp. McD22-P3]|uniref:lysine N(6)-hydroxylase/L-ornithine N(5)-oxygenase family protein n=1 Tax=Vibrio sp. McD22-P3 TaxID=2724880 RepID=UPI001F4653E4|nr:SidA/IucD/PvdA family monooxygenase [Vibrio sp. McD22-P3]MCF4172307.1 SidA/IucD/PvdA family monooxygenase [Vibrio sp. McD22-P3]
MTNSKQHEIYDLVGIGAGPFNLSIAALSNEVNTLKTVFLEARSEFSWHPGLLLDGANMQTHFLKDLVSAVCPTSEYSFLNYLVSNKKYYRFLSTEQSCISRQEFSDYLSWASKNMPNVVFDSAVQNIEKHDGLYHIHTKYLVYRARHICLGTGKTPYFPECTKPSLGANVFHAAEIGLRERNLTGRRVTIIGGGQSGADIFLNVLREKWGKPSHLNWVTRRANYQPLDEAAFTNEYFTPEYVDTFIGLNDKVKQREIAHQKLTSDGVTQKCLLEIYQELYQRFDVMKEKRWIELLPHRTLTALEETSQGLKLKYANAITETDEEDNADIVILATGYQGQLPSCAKALESSFKRDQNRQIRLNGAFSIEMSDSDEIGNVFVVNAGLHSHGIAEPQLSLAAWRAAKIINQVADQAAFDIEAVNGLMNWGNINMERYEDRALKELATS